MVDLLGREEAVLRKKHKFAFPGQLCAPGNAKYKYWVSMTSTLTNLRSPVLVAKGQPCCLGGTVLLKEVHKGVQSIFLLGSGTVSPP